MVRKKLLKITGALVALMVILCVIAHIFLLDYSLPKEAATAITDENIYVSADKNGVDAIHFLNTGSSDAIIIESNGLFAMVDAGEDNDYPADKPNLKLQGYEDEVLAYLKQIASDENGKVTLEFILGTHAHSDHIGGFDTIISDDSVTVKKAFLKQYNPDFINNYETKNWDNLEVYEQMVGALSANGVEIDSMPVSEPFALGDFTVRLFNAEPDINQRKKGENENSFGVKLTKGDKSVFLAGDINYKKDNDEKRIAEAIGDIDLLKLGHHGHTFSSSRYFIRTLAPEVAIATSSETKISKFVLATLKNYLVPVYTTVENDGIIAVLTDDGRVVLDKSYCMNMPDNTDAEF